jgi:hypothetical protein
METAGHSGVASNNHKWKRAFMNPSVAMVGWTVRELESQAIVRDDCQMVRERHEIDGGSTAQLAQSPYPSVPRGRPSNIRRGMLRRPYFRIFL